MKELLIYVLLTVYMVYSIVKSIGLYEEKRFYTKKQKFIHLLLIWLVPFIWAMFLKEVNTTLPGSHHFDKTKVNLGHEGNNDVDTMG